MANIKQIKIDSWVQVTMNGKGPNVRARVVGLTDKKAYVQLMPGGKYERDANGNPIKKLIDPNRIKFYN